MHRKPTAALLAALSVAWPAAAATHRSAWTADTGNDCAISDTVGRNTLRVSLSGSSPGLIIELTTLGQRTPPGDRMNLNVWGGPTHILALGHAGGAAMTTFSAELSDGLGSPERPIGRDLIAGLESAAGSDDGGLHIALADVEGAEPDLEWDTDHVGLEAALRAFEGCLKKTGRTANLPAAG